MRYFEVPDGARVAMVSRQIGTASKRATAFFDRVAFTTAIATEDFCALDGRWRRRFTAMSPPLVDYTSDLWVADGEVLAIVQQDVEELAWR